MTGARAVWNLSAAESSSGAEARAATWVGIGGYVTRDVVAVGFQVNVTSGPATATYSAWWEMAPLPAQSIRLSPTPALTAGDSVNASVSLMAAPPNGSQQWKLQLGDTTTHSGWSSAIWCVPGTCNVSTFTSAEWVEGAPVVNGTASPVPVFADFNTYGVGEQINGSTWRWLVPYEPYQNATTILLNNPRYSSADLVIPGGFSVAGAFLVSYALDMEQEHGRSTDYCCTSHPYAAVPGQELRANLQIWSPTDVVAVAQARVAIVLQIGSASYGCRGVQNATPGFPVYRGYQTYQVRALVCDDLPDGTLSWSIQVYYVPAGLSPGDPGTLLLASSGALGSVTVERFWVPTPTSSPLSGHIAAGQNWTLWANVTASSSLIAPLHYTWSGLPFPCAQYEVGTSSSTRLELQCTPLSWGTYNISLRVTDQGGASNASAVPLRFSILADPSVTLNVSRSTLDMGANVTFQATALGGFGAPFHYAWSGLPLGCAAEDLPQIQCAPLIGNYTVVVNATDSGGVKVVSNAVHLSVSLPPIILLIANVTNLSVGGEVFLHAGIVGGLPPYTINWTGLPPGCTAVLVTFMNCTPSAVGHFEVSMVVSDSNGVSRDSNAWPLNVTAQASTAAPRQAGAAGYPLTVWIYWAAVGAAAIAAIVVVARRPTPPPSARTGP